MIYIISSLLFALLLHLHLQEHCSLQAFQLPLSSRRKARNNHSEISMVYFQRDDVNDLVKKADMIVGLPTEISITDLAAFKKQVWKCKDEVMGSASMTEAIDSTPFCMMAEHIRGKSHMFVFVPTEEVTNVYECLGKWTRSISRNKNAVARSDSNSKDEPLKIIIGKRQGHVVCIHV